MTKSESTRATSRLAPFRALAAGLALSLAIPIFASAQSLEYFPQPDRVAAAGDEARFWYSRGIDEYNRAVSAEKSGNYKEACRNYKHAAGSFDLSLSELKLQYMENKTVQVGWTYDGGGINSNQRQARTAKATAKLAAKRACAMEKAAR
ncbi:MAG: hypothetical protein ABL914_08220 [Novosphingobium sp.]|uniref:hypothetical protein n=1 Tax=Novosphingobium sp. TaxID=1874826 RepID=UPI0032B9E969